MMDIRKIKNLAEILDSMNLTELEVTEGNNKILLKREVKPQYNPDSESFQSDKRTQEQNATSNTPSDDENSDTFAIKAPFTGVFYVAPSPDSPPFVTVGDKVSKGDVICILEAMKLMNEIKAETDCIIKEVCAENGSIVEYGQPLFKCGKVD